MNLIQPCKSLFFLPLFCQSIDLGKEMFFVANAFTTNLTKTNGQKLFGQLLLLFVVVAAAIFLAARHSSNWWQQET